MKKAKKKEHVEEEVDEPVVPLELQDALRIDKHNLDEELIRQPEIFYRVSNLSVRASAEVSSLQQQIDNLKAELDGRIRDQAESKNGNAGKKEKLKEKEIALRIASSPKMQTLQNKLIRVKEEANSLSALKEAFIQRSYALKDLTALYAAQYWVQESGSKIDLEDNSERIRKETGKLRRKKLGSKGRKE